MYLHGFTESTNRNEAESGFELRDGECHQTANRVGADDQVPIVTVRVCFVSGVRRSAARLQGSECDSGRLGRHHCVAVVSERSGECAAERSVCGALPQVLGEGRRAGETAARDWLQFGRRGGRLRRSHNERVQDDAAADNG